MNIRSMMYHPRDDHLRRPQGRGRWLQRLSYNAPPHIITTTGAAGRAFAHINIKLGLHLNVNKARGNEARQNIWSICTLFGMRRDREYTLHLNVSNVNSLWSTDSLQIATAVCQTFVAQFNAVCLASITHPHHTFASFLQTAFTFCLDSDVNLV